MSIPKSPSRETSPLLGTPESLIETNLAPHESAAATKKLLIATILCFFFFLIELAMGLYSNSLAILNIAGFTISLVAIYVTKHTPDSQKLSSGYHRAEIIGAVLSTLLIWVLTGVLIYEAVDRINNPMPINAKVMFFTALLGVVVNVVLGFTLHEHHGHDHGHKHGHEGHEHGDDNHSHGDNHSHDDGDEIGRQLNHSAHTTIEDRNLVSEEAAVVVVGKKKRNINLGSAAVHVIGDLLSSIGVLISSIIIWIEPSYTIIDPICTFVFSFFVFGTTVAFIMMMFPGEKRMR